jgi:hypothetical protein
MLENFKNSTEGKSFIFLLCHNVSLNTHFSLYHLCSSYHLFVYKNLDKSFSYIKKKLVCIYSVCGGLATSYS